MDTDSTGCGISVEVLTLKELLSLLVTFLVCDSIYYLLYLGLNLVALQSIL